MLQSSSAGNFAGLSWQMLDRVPGAPDPDHALAGDLKRRTASCFRSTSQEVTLLTVGIHRHLHHRGQESQFLRLPRGFWSDDGLRHASSSIVTRCSPSLPDGLWQPGRRYPTVGDGNKATKMRRWQEFLLDEIGVDFQAIDPLAKEIVGKILVRILAISAQYRCNTTAMSY